jgi:hypothetical protein
MKQIIHEIGSFKVVKSDIKSQTTLRQIDYIETYITKSGLLDGIKNNLTEQAFSKIGLQSIEFTYENVSNLIGLFFKPSEGKWSVTFYNDIMEYLKLDTTDIELSESLTNEILEGISDFLYLIVKKNKHFFTHFAEMMGSETKPVK